MRLMTGMFWFGVLVGAIALSGCTTTGSYSEIRYEGRSPRTMCVIPNIWDARVEKCRAQGEWL